METIEETIAGTPVKLLELNTYDKHKLRKLYRENERAKLLARLKAVEATKPEITDALAAFDDDPPRDWVNYINEGEGFYAVLRISLEKGLKAEGRADATEAANALIENLDWPEGKLSSTVMKLADLHFKEPAAGDSPVYGEPDAGGAGADPSTGPVYGEPAPATARKTA